MSEKENSECEEEKTISNVHKVMNSVTGLVHSVRNRYGPQDTPRTTYEILLVNEMKFHNAAKKNDVKTMTELQEEKVNINAKNNHGLTVLHLAAWSANLNIVQMLIKAGANQKATNEDGMNVLHFAAQNNKNDIVDYLLKDLQLNDLNAPDKKGRKPFHLAAEKGHLTMINNLLSVDLFTNEKDQDGNTALHLAAMNGHCEVLDVLIDLWENKDELNEQGATPFYMAVEGGHELCASHLLKAECNINITNNDGYSALHVAAQNGHRSLVNFLIANKIDFTPKPDDKNPPLHLAILHDHMSIVDELLEAGYDINVINVRNQSALHLAAELKNTDLVEKLLKTGCDLTIADKQGKTALNVAARTNHTLIVDMIIKADRYYTWKMGLTENNEPMHQDVCLTFKPDHLVKTSQIRSAFWNLAYNQLKPHEWKKLAQRWNFTEVQIKAIEEQWTGKASYREHGHRMLLIWLHGILLANQNPIKCLYEDLMQTGNPQLAENFRIESSNAVGNKKCRIS
ncbi:ankyrin repeat and death domain-containing protein 1B isoform X3 [Bombina bombina]|uniref:ankyrin repeat and death domain-containing protein 1B isoform X3 n=1 Tax=Bombina bombina TaxID=8345 RepID=UPI00235B036F|nr:ankyrin repeat and death domain-containing protein 1B isoform X3 [Bombina bombina]